MRTPNTPKKIFNVFFLLFTGIALYLIGAYGMIFNYIPKYITPLELVFQLGIALLLLFLVLLSQSAISFYIFALILGTFHQSFFRNASLIDSNIVLNALLLTCFIFGGLTFIAFWCPTSGKFITYGSLYTILLNITWLLFLNLFLHNELLDLCLICISIGIFSLYTIKDIHQITNDDNGPVYHALNLFLNFVNFFVDIIRLLIKIKKSKK